MAFTPITNGDDLQRLDILNELQTTYSEHNQVVEGGAAIADLVAGQDIQDLVLWDTWQKWVDDHLHLFINHDLESSFAGSTGSNADIFLGNFQFTVATFRALSGLTSGFRRVPLGVAWPTSWAVYSNWGTNPGVTYGRIQEGDIIGPWLWVDLQTAFNTLRMTVGACTEKNSYQMTGSGSSGNRDTAWTNFCDDWDADSWVAGGGYYLASRNWLAYAVYSANRTYSDMRMRLVTDCAPYHKNILCTRPFDWKVYVFALLYGVYVDPPGTPGHTYNTGIDFDLYGFVDGVFQEFSSGTAAVAVTPSTYIGFSSANPASDSTGKYGSWSASNPPYYVGPPATGCGQAADEVKVTTAPVYTMKWDFTYKNY